MEKISVVGIWHQGAVAAACLADAGYNVVGFDHDQARVSDLNIGKAPLFEPGLDDLLAKAIKSGRLSFTSDIKQGLADVRNIIIAFDTPVDENDEVDLSGIYMTAREMAPYLMPDSVIVVTAQVPVGTSEKIAALIRETNPHADFGIAYSPENLRLGQAIERYKLPPMPVIGADSEMTLDRVGKLFSPFPVSWMRMSLRSAEMTKHALNAFLAVSICFANEIGNLCDEVGADAQQVAMGLRLEPRIGPKAMLFPGLGFSGGTLARDIKTLQHLGDHFGYETSVIDGAWEANGRQNGLVVQKMRKIFGSLDGLHVAVLGLTYKTDTSTLRRSVSIEIIHDMVSQGAVVKAYDPMADRQELSSHMEFEFCADAYRAVEGCDVLILITPWPEFKKLDYQRIQTLLKRPLIFDPQNMLEHEPLSQMGFVHVGIGRGISIDKGII